MLNLVFVGLSKNFKVNFHCQTRVSGLSLSGCIYDFLKSSAEYLLREDIPRSYLRTDPQVVGEVIVNKLWLYCSQIIFDTNPPDSHLE